MRNIVEIQQKLLPDLLSVMQKRYEILRYIRLMQPIGRRSLSTNLGLSERVLRSEVDFLKKQDLLNISTSGMTLTQEGTILMRQLEEFMKEVSGLKVLEEGIKNQLQLRQVVIVPGNSDTSPWVKNEMGRACVASMNRYLKEENIIAVTGGTTISAVAEMMAPESKNRNLLFVPARGGLGENVQNQANTICAAMAEKTKGQYRLLHTPDELSNDAYQSMIAEPSIKEVLTLIKNSSMVVHSIGDAKMMAMRRKTAPENMKKIEQCMAVAEAFGYYFNSDGEVVHRVQTVGMQLADLEKIETVIAVAGGASKANAIRAYLKQAPHTILITDEGAAKELIRETLP
ncbi:sugar-binding transcriptional regulator [Sutcliffiella cohnii]|uniref:sugar-binding transcriptional regulator n=1 Tax=Sutcliffiella cohnii TaxID=33932 RepID=UPI002E1D3CA3|nr:sugar-binding domain-containing protein [Sutcliffiella cohnii]MED4016562.1 sugar-binding domain-containing protein [Sutcliffiella cohnii]